MPTEDNPTSKDGQEAFDAILAGLMRAIDSGQPLNSDEWPKRYPNFATELEEFFEKHERVEELFGPLRQAAAHVLHVRCPHCYNPIELLEDALLTEIGCPSCGSSFSLVGDKTVSHYLPGEKTIGHFQLLDRVGIGAFGSVWKAKDTQLDRTVAVKIPRHSQLDESQVELFLRDARAAAQLKHPNIVSVHEVGKQDDTIYIVSDFIQGVTLKEWMAAKRLLPREIAELCVKIAKALHHAHESGVIHRDLKPGNIMMDTDGEPYIVDFGLAKREAAEITMTVDGQILGTPAYMSPEQARGEGHTVDCRADIYSLGVILFELLTGELPFRGDKQMLLVQILKDDPPSPRKLNSSVPRDLETICLKCLEKEPGKRYTNAIEVSDDLSNFLCHRAIRIRPIGRMARVARWCRRNPLAAMLFVVSGMAVACAAGVIVAVLYQSELERYNTSLQNALTSARYAKKDADSERAKARDEEARAKQAAELSRRYHYVSQIKLAELAIVEGQHRDAFLALEQLIPDGNTRDLRGLEWFYLWRQCRGPTHTIPGPEAVRCIAIDPSGQLAAIAHANGLVTIQQLVNGEELTSFKLDEPALSLAFVRDPLRLCVVNTKGVVTAWNLERRQLGTAVDLGKTFEVAHFSIGGELLVAVAEGSDDLTIHSCVDGTTVFSGKCARNPLQGLAEGYQTPLIAMNDDGDRIVSAVGDNVIVINVASNETQEPYRLTGARGGRVGCVAISQDGQLFAAGEAFPETIHDRDVRKKDYRVKAWDATNGAELCSFVGHELPIRVIAISPDRKRVATASRDQSIKIWSLEKGGEPIVTLYGQTSFTTVTFDPDGKHLFAGDSAGTVRIWQLEPKDTSLVLKGKKMVGEVVFIDGDQRIIGNPNVWDLSTGEKVGELDHALLGGCGRIAITADERYVSGGANLLELDSLDRAPPTFERKRNCLDVAFNLDGTYIATAGPESEVRVIDLATGDVLRRFTFLKRAGRKQVWATSVAFGPTENAVLTATANDTHGEIPGHVKLWDLETGECVQEFSGHRHSVWRVAVDREGKKIAAATGNYRGNDVDNDVWIWDAQTGEVLHVLKGHRECVYDVDFSPDGGRLASVSGYHGRARQGYDPPGELKLWDLRTGQELLSIENANAGFVSTAFDHSGAQVAVGATDGTVTVFRPSYSR